MYKRYSKSWVKHLDFIVIDLLCLQVAFILSYWLNVKFGNPYYARYYQYQLLVLTMSQLAIIMFTDAYSGILRRGVFAEAIAVLKNAACILVLAVVYLFAVHQSVNVSRLQFGFTMVFFTVLSYSLRQLNKRRILRSGGGRRRKSMVLVTSSRLVVKAMKSLEGHDGYKDYFVSGVLLLDHENRGQLPDFGIPVVPLNTESVLEVCRGWVDEIFVLQPDDMPLPVDLIDAFMQSGMTVNLAPLAMADGRWPITDMREVGGFKVFTVGAHAATMGQAAMKRLIDVAGGIVGCLITAVLFVFVAPAILVKSPGPIFFAQERVGRNGKIFRMYKFRSMRPDAEARKAELSGMNKVGDGMMFKIDDDPRIIDGIGSFIRRTSIDEFPQFFNVLKGDMSLVGTRPPTVDEWERYNLWHRSRLSVKPGITGLWQVSGRSEITDFTEVVRLDRQYIEEWSLLLDLKIILKTFSVVVKRKGAG